VREGRQKLIGEDRRKRKIPSLGKANTPMGTGRERKQEEVPGQFSK
jgi:hypothetical protein